jgi:hypothetical protein
MGGLGWKVKRTTVGIAGFHGVENAARAGEEVFLGQIAESVLLLGRGQSVEKLAGGLSLVRLTLWWPRSGSWRFGGIGAGVFDLERAFPASFEDSNVQSKAA